MPTLRKTSVYLTEAEADALRLAATQARRSRSSLLRQGVRLVADAAARGRLDEHDPPLPSPYDLRGLREPCQPELTHDESLILAYISSGWLPADIAESRPKFSLDDVLELHRTAFAKLAGGGPDDSDGVLEPLWSDE